jgi:hypothetical protein
MENIVEIGATANHRRQAPSIKPGVKMGIGRLDALGASHPHSGQAEDTIYKKTPGGFPPGVVIVKPLRCDQG